jgi:hypothetical protein
MSRMLEKNFAVVGDRRAQPRLTCRALGDPRSQRRVGAIEDAVVSRKSKFIEGLNQFHRRWAALSAIRFDARPGSEPSLKTRTPTDRMPSRAAIAQSKTRTST